jgi:EAL domain-containing protein (putative c-di-GMP-specific phosphodiesterase class I)
MRLERDSLWLVAVALCACAAMGIAAYGIGSGRLSTTLLATAIIALGAGLVMAQMRAHFRATASDDMEQDFRVLAHRLDVAEQSSRDWRFSQEGLSQQISALRDDTSLSAVQLTQGLEDIRIGHASIAQQIQTLLTQPLPTATSRAAQLFPAEAAPPPPPLYTPSFNYADPPPLPEAPANGPPPRLTDKLTLALEPVIDLYSMQTAHYRMIVSMLNDWDLELAPDRFQHKVAQMGQEAEVDLFVIREALGILEKLRQRDANLCIITAVGATTLSDAGVLRDIINLMLERREVSAGLVIEVSHDVLAGLSDASLEGLALLARAGVALAFASASIPGADLGALSKLNVRYVSLAATSLGPRERLSETFGGFVQAARALRIQIIVTQVNDARQMQDISRTARYASGKAFAAPRRLKREDDASGTFAPALRAVA